VVGVGIGIPERRVIEDVSDYYWAIFDPMARSVYERNITATRVDFGAFIQVDSFGIGIAQPTMSEPERQAVRCTGRSSSPSSALPPSTCCTCVAIAACYVADKRTVRDSERIAARQREAAP